MTGWIRGSSGRNERNLMNSRWHLHTSIVTTIVASVAPFPGLRFLSLRPLLRKAPGTAGIPFLVLRCSRLRAHLRVLHSIMNNRSFRPPTPPLRKQGFLPGSGGSAGQHQALPGCTRRSSASDKNSMLLRILYAVIHSSLQTEVIKGPGCKCHGPS